VKRRKKFHFHSLAGLVTFFPCQVFSCLSGSRLISHHTHPKLFHYSANSSCFCSVVFADAPKPTLVQSVEVNLDAGKFLTALVEQVRMLVLRAVATATKTSMPLSTDAQPVPSATGTSSGGVGGGQSQEDTTQRNLSSFRSMLSLNSKSLAHNEEASLTKAESSALKLNSVLRGDKTPSLISPLGLRKNRSVHWDSPAQIPALQPGNALAPQPKKPRLAQRAAKLASFKSFGRPHAGDFGSGPRNATFGEFSRAQMWGRDGRMAHHPMPMQKQSMFTMEEPQPKGNANFQVPSSVRLTSSFQRGTSLPRSATVLENILLKKASGKL
jgi:hypothetical protein